MSMPYSPEFSHNDVEILNEAVISQGYIPIKQYVFNYRQYEGTVSQNVTREVTVRPPAAAVLLFDPKKDQVILIEQIRVGVLESNDSPWILDIVAGLNDEGESIEETAIRESIEEASSEILKLIPILEFYPSVGISNERTFIFCGLVNVDPFIKKYHGLKEDGEDIKVYIVSAEEAFKLLKEAKIKAASAVIALQWLMLNRESLRSLQEI